MVSSELHLTHRLLLEGQDRLDGLERVVVVVELHRVGAHGLLVVLQVVDARPGVLAADAVRGEDHLLAQVDRREAGAAREDVDEVAELVLAQRLHLGAFGAGLGAGADVGLDLVPGHVHQRPVAHAGRDPVHASPTVREHGRPGASWGRAAP